VSIGDEVYSGCRSTGVKTCMFFPVRVECVVGWWKIQAKGNLMSVIFFPTREIFVYSEGS
jgi:hypothetical protein